MVILITFNQLPIRAQKTCERIVGQRMRPDWMTGNPESVGSFLFAETRPIGHGHNEGRGALIGGANKKMTENARQKTKHLHAMSRLSIAVRC